MNKDETLDFLVSNRIYPMCSKKGKIFLKHPKSVLLSKEQAQEIIESLNIKTPEECTKARNEIKELVAKNNINIPINKWVIDERPREMLLKQGADKLALSKLLAIILRTGKEGESAEELARKLLNKFRSLRGIDLAPISEICKIEGIGTAKSAQIKAALELGKRLFRERAEKANKIKKAEDVVLYVREFYGPYLRDAKKEFFAIILLDIKNKPIKNIDLSKGSINASIVDPKEIIKEVTLNSASSIILVHNHPSGEPEPSQEDLDITNRIIKSCELVGVKVLDHVIIGKNEEDFFSFAQKGLIK
jgi:DNA repair protein RadC